MVSIDVWSGSSRIVGVASTSKYNPFAESPRSSAEVLGNCEIEGAREANSHASWSSGLCQQSGWFGKVPV